MFPSSVLQACAKADKRRDVSSGAQAAFLRPPSCAVDRYDQAVELSAAERSHAQKSAERNSSDRSNWTIPKGQINGLAWNILLEYLNTRRKSR